MDYFQQAIDRDPITPSPTRPRGLLLLTFFNNFTISQAESAAKSRAAATKALELDPSLAEAMSPWAKSSKTLIGVLMVPSESFAGRWSSTRDTVLDCSGMRNSWRIWGGTTNPWL